MGDHRQMSSSTLTLNGSRRHPDAILDDWKNYLRKVFNKSRRPDRWAETIDEYPDSTLSSMPANYGTRQRRAPDATYGTSMFGRRLKDSVDEATGVAKFVLWCVEAIVTSGDGLDTNAIYRTAGNQARIQEIVKQGENGMREKLQREDNVNVLTSALKLFFRELVNPIIDYDDFSRALQTESPDEEVVFLVQGLPAAERNTLYYMMSHLQDVLDHHAVNSMDIPALASVFGPTLIRLSTNPQDMSFDMKQQNRIVEFLLAEHDTIFPRRDGLTKLDVHQQLHSGSSDSDTGAYHKDIVDKTRPGTITYNTKTSEEDEKKDPIRPSAYEYSQGLPVEDQLHSKIDNAEFTIQTFDNIKPQPHSYRPTEEDVSFYEDVESHTSASDKKTKNFFSAKLSNFMEDSKKKIVKSQDKQIKPKHVLQTNELVEKQQHQHDPVTTSIESSQHERSDVFENHQDEYAIVLKKSERNIPKDIPTVDYSLPPKLPSTSPPIYRKNHIYTLDTYNNRQLRKSLEELDADQHLTSNVHVYDSSPTEIKEDPQQRNPSLSNATHHREGIHPPHNNYQTEAATRYSNRQQTVFEPQQSVTRTTLRKESDSDSSSTMSNQDPGSDSEPDTRYRSLRSVPTAL